MKAEDIKPGVELVILDRGRVRSGAGPEKHRVAEVWHSLGGACVFRVVGNRGRYTNTEAYASMDEAKLAWSERAEAELARERSRFNKIAGRLGAWQLAIGKAA